MEHQVMDTSASALNLPGSISYWRSLTDHGAIYDAVLTNEYRGSGTDEDPYVVEWLPNDRRNPFNWTMATKVWKTTIISLSSLSVAFSSSAYLSPSPQLQEHFDVSLIVVILGISMFNLGFATGPFIWGPLSETYGRQSVFLASFVGVTIFNGGCTAAQSMAALLVLRFFTGFCAASPLTNSGAMIADMFPQSQRGLAMSAFIVSPYLGPALGPIVSGWVAEYAGWRWVLGVMTLFTGAMLIVGAFVVTETYAPYLLQHRAQRLSKLTGKVYRDAITLDTGKISAKEKFKVIFSRPWLLLIREPIITLLSIYMAIIYGTLYSFFSAFPIVYRDIRGWSQGTSGLAFIGVSIGMVLGVVGAIITNVHYRKLMARGLARPEKRLYPAMVGSILVPASLFWWAFTNSPSISAIASIAAGVPFAIGMVLTYLAVSNYIIDSYGVFSASALAANAFLRCSFGAIFPLFTPAQYQNLGIHWAAALMGFLAVMCAPFPFLFYIYGERIRKNCKYSAEAERLRERIAEKRRNESEDVDRGQSQQHEENKTEGA